MRDLLIKTVYIQP